MSRKVDQLVLIADLGGTFVFALEGALAGVLAGFDPVGVLVLAFLTALGGGVMRDVLIGARPVAAVADWRYTVAVLSAAFVTWVFHAWVKAIPIHVLIAFDACGLALFVVAGTFKALDFKIHPLVAIFLGTVSGVGGGVMRDVLLNRVPHILQTDIYATAGMAGAIVITLSRGRNWRRRYVAVAAAILCVSLRMIAVAYNWQLPTSPF
ncbi:trimeric intracellular cation channel family protein [Labrys neptuniae]